MPDGSFPVRPILPIGEIDECCEAIRMNLDSLDTLKTQIGDQWNPDCVVLHLMSLCCDNARERLAQISTAIASATP